MRFARAERFLSTGRARWWVAGLALLTLLVGVGATLLRPGTPTAEVPAHPANRPATGAATRQATASDLLTRLARSLERGPRSRVLDLAAPGDEAARSELAAIVHNVRGLGVVDLAMRYVDEDAGALGPAGRRRFGDTAWVADVQLGWRLRGFDHHRAEMEVSLVLAATRGGARFVSAARDFGNPAPLWLLGRLAVQRGDRSLVMVAGGDGRRFSAMAERAVSDVRHVLPHWHDDLVVEVPATRAQLDRVLGAPPHQYDEIAAVTTTVDGSRRTGAPVHVFVNPEVFAPLGPRGGQIVVSHEATHVATHAVDSGMPTWLLEGFADYVALARVPLPVSVTASQILGSVRRHGPPGHLPGAAEFNPANTALGASYEAAWLACRLLAETYGPDRLVRFYRMADRDASTAQPFRKVLDTTQRAFTRRWQAYLRKLAG